ncbi:hypothetical protein SAMN05443575_3291 [Jatrophihabitans endophyticus]|uniref:Uncharacterized protein n=1 Tax=Jatrophihabitans endophyticus TaxID=1206085 RepID=A0A1M5Q4J1_9ACTN|nr:hypothetical protein [Jatrophihabitans endophyticus]SHH08922.1 hypothetical protein SAMN05443575_3291 [Jatrophihabitans endophyticus]
MRTEADLHAAFALLERIADETATPSPAPPERPAAAAPKRSGGRNRPLAVAASVAAVALVAAAALVLAGRDGERHRVADPHPSGSTGTSRSAVTMPPAVSALRTLPWRTLAFTVDHPGLRPAGVLLDRDVQILQLVGTAGSYVVRVYPDGAKAPVTTAGATPVTVNGRPGVYAQLRADPVGAQRGVAWQYAPGAWASVARSDAGISRRAGIALAEDVGVGRPSVVRTPVLFAPGSGLTTGSWLTSLGNDPHNAGQHGYSGWSALYDLRLGKASLTVTADAMPRDLPGRAGTDQVTIHGRTASVTVTSTSRAVSIDYDGPVLTIEEQPEQDIGGGFRLSRADLLAVARSVTLVPHPADVTTWHDAREALPH